MVILIKHAMHSMFARAAGGSKPRIDVAQLTGTAALPLGRVSEILAPVTYNTAGAVTITADQVLSGMLIRDCNGADRTDTLPTAALLRKAMPSMQIGQILDFVVVNNGSANTVTVAVGSGGTGFTGSTLTAAFGNFRRFRIRMTNVTPGSEAYTLYALGGGTN